MKRIRRSVEEMIENSNQGTGVVQMGIRCPACGCVQFGEGRHVRHTVPVDNAVRRYRVCRACGHKWTTNER